jgi:hypothetical protein
MAMPCSDATDICLKVKVPMELKKESPYVIFKVIMLKQAKKQSKSEIMSSITMATKTTSWKDAEDCPVDNSSQNDTINNEFKKDEDSCFEFIVE